MQAEADGFPPEMEENDTIEPLREGDLFEETRGVTSDFEPSEEESTFGSVTSSVNDHVWEYGRYAAWPLALSSYGRSA